MLLHQWNMNNQPELALNCLDKSHLFEQSFSSRLNFYSSNSYPTWTKLGQPLLDTSSSVTTVDNQICLNPTVLLFYIDLENKVMNVTFHFSIASMICFGDFILRTNAGHWHSFLKFFYYLQFIVKTEHFMLPFMSY